MLLSARMVKNQTLQCMERNEKKMFGPRSPRLWVIRRQRGIRVCPRWEKFEHFLADMGEPKSGLSLKGFTTIKDIAKRTAHGSQSSINQIIVVIAYLLKLVV